MSHSRSIACKFAQDWSGLAQQANADIKAISEILPNETAGALEMWRTIIGFFRDQHVVWNNGANQWEAKPTAKPGPEEAEHKLRRQETFATYPRRYRSNPSPRGTSDRRKSPMSRTLSVRVEPEFGPIRPTLHLSRGTETFLMKNQRQYANGRIWRNLVSKAPLTKSRTMLQSTQC